MNDRRARTHRPLIAHRTCLLGVVLSLLALPSWRLDAQEVTASSESIIGIWIVTIITPDGALEMTWELEGGQDGFLSGVIRSELTGESPIDGGWIDDHAFGFSALMEAQDQQLEVVFEGSFGDVELSGVLVATNASGAEFSSDFTGAKSDGPTSRDTLLETRYED